MKHTVVLLLSLGAGAAAALGQSKSSSANYEILHAPLGVGGGHIGVGSAIKSEISVGELFGGQVSNVTASGAQHKPNYIGQLYDVASLTVDATPATVNEGATRQLAATATLDDATLLALAAHDVQWSVVLGPLTGIDATGLATAGAVYQDTAATAEGSYLGIDDQLVLTVLDSDPDNYGSYAGDGLSDEWQVEFFGDPPNPDAAPDANPDGDPYDNRFEQLTGYSPVDPGDFFQLSVVSRSGTTNTLELSKLVPGTRYRIERTSDMVVSDPWSEFTNFTTLSEAFDHQLDDPNAAGLRWFYRVGVEPE